MLFALTGYEDGVLVVFFPTDGITVDGSATVVSTDDSTSYMPPVVGNDGLLVMPMEEYFSGIERSTVYVGDNNCYAYKYIDQGRSYGGEGSDEYRDMYVKYVEDLVATGYYTLLGHDEDNKFCETWRLGYTGDQDLETFRVWKYHDADAAIVVDLLFEDGRVYYSQDIATTNLEEAAIEAGLLDDNDGGDWDDDWDDDDKRECPRCWGSGESQCTTCWGQGQVSSSFTSSGRETCGSCFGRGRTTCGFCYGTGTIN